MAQKDSRSMRVATVSQATSEAMQEFHQRLVVETGTIVKLAQENPLEAARDEAGFAALKAMAIE